MSVSKEKRAAEFEVTGEMLAEVLHLPSDSVITHCRDKEGSWPGNATLILRVESVSLPAAKEGEPIPRCTPTLANHEGMIVFRGWGLK